MAADEADACAEWVEASVDFVGPCSGRLSCWLPGPPAHELCEAFSGESITLLSKSEVVADVIGEFTNMICGTWLTRVTDPGSHYGALVPFALSPPVVDVVRTAGDEEAVVVNDRPVLVRVALDGE